MSEYIEIIKDGQNPFDPKRFINILSENLKANFREWPLIEAKIRVDLVNACWNQGWHELFRSHAEEAFRLRNEHLDREHPDLLEAKDRLADLREIQGRFEEAERMRLELLETQRRVVGEERGIIVLFMNNLGRLYLTLGRYADAEKMLETSLDLHRRRGQQDLSTWIAMARLAAAYQGQGKFQEAEHLYLRAIKSRVAEFNGADDLWVLSFRSGLGSLYIDTGRYEEARSLLSEALDTARRQLRQGHQVTGKLLRNYGASLTALQRYPEAESALLESHGILQNARGAEYERPEKAVQSLVDLYLAWGRPRDADRWRNGRVKSEK